MSIQILGDPSNTYRVNQEIWNPVTGCTKLSPGCRVCFASRHAAALRTAGNPMYMNKFEPTVHNSQLDKPLHWRKPRLVNVATTSDLFHESFSDELISGVFDTMTKCPQHQFLVQTKRSGRLQQLSSDLNISSNIWLGVSVESEQYVYRIDELRSSGARHLWVAYEPLIEEIKTVDLEGIEWVVVGKLSCPGRQVTLEVEWVRTIMNACVNSEIPFFYKKPMERRERWTEAETFDGQLWNQMPEAIECFRSVGEVVRAPGTSA